MNQLGDIDTWLGAFRLDTALHAHACDVMRAIPADVRADLMGDDRFAISDYEPVPGAVMEVPVGRPTFNNASRSVVLKRTLNRRAPAFVRYVIAHELAHAYLRNAGRSPNEDPEHAADALAAQWGFPRTPWA